MSQSKNGFQAGPCSIRKPVLRAGLIAPGLILGPALLSLGLGGCTKVDSWFDPSNIGYWEHTPTQVPILRRLNSIEGPDDEYVEISEITADDLTPDLAEYRIGPGDQLQIILWDVPIPGQPTPFDRLVDHRGMVDLPQLGEVYVANMTLEQARNAFAQVMADKNLVNRDALVSVTVSNPQQRMYTLMGAVAGPGPHFIPRSDYRLLEALGDAGGIAETVRDVLIIRQVALSDSMTPVRPGSASTAPAQPAPKNAPPDNSRLLDLIDQIGGDKGQGGNQTPSGGGSPGVLASEDSGTVYKQPAATRPPVDLVNSTSPSQPDFSGGGSWVFINNRWVQVQTPTRPAGTAPADNLPRPRDLMTQRVIRVPVPELLAGDARYNPVVRPGDVIRVPNPSNGTIYIGGEINRPGAFSMAPGLTLMRVIDAAGGLSSLGIPERVDIVRMTGPERQGMIRINLRAINEGTQPDIFMKANDRVNVGTSFWAYPLAVARNGFRFTYGFGFIFDRNFSDYIIGPYTGNSLINP